MTRRLTCILIAASCLFCQCGSKQDEDGNGSDYPTEETFCAIDSCMSYMKSAPHKAHTMLDSLNKAGLMTKARCDYFHAMVVFCGENNLDSALTVCDRLLEEGKFGDDRYLEEEICVLASNITSGNGRHIETLNYANRGIVICHGNEKMHDDEATLMGRMGEAEQALGRIESARETYAKARKLLEGNESFAALVTLISLQKKEASLCRETKDYDGMVSVCHDILDLVERFDRDPSMVKLRPETMQTPGEATHEFATFYKIQMYAQLARAHRLKIESGLSESVEADRDSVNAYIDRWNAAEDVHSPEECAHLLPELYFAGRTALFEEAKQATEALYRGDSLVVEYANYLSILAKDAADRQDYKASAFYQRRALAINDSIKRRDLDRMLTEQMSIYMVQEERLARQDAEYALKRYKLIFLILVVLVAAGTVIAVLIRRNKVREELLEDAQQDLSETKEDIIELVKQLEEAKQERSIKNTQALYDRIEKEMNDGKLYLNPELDVKKLAELVCSSRSVVSLCINSMTGKSFRQWLSEYRLMKFEEMLRENPEESIEGLVMRCGYKDSSTFRRQFKAAYDMTPGEYKNKLMEERGLVKVNKDEEDVNKDEEE